MTRLKVNLIVFEQGALSKHYKVLHTPAPATNLIGFQPMFFVL
jgi:hypothetical protein